MSNASLGRDLPKISKERFLVSSSLDSVFVADGKWALGKISYLFHESYRQKSCQQEAKKPLAPKTPVAVIHGPLPQPRMKPKMRIVENGV